MTTLAGKVGLVTGGSGSIGGAIAERLAREGLMVVISYVGFEEGANAALDAVREAGSDGMIVPLDQRDPDSIDRTIEQVIEQYSRLDVLVNNAAWNIGIPFPDLDSLTPDVWDRVLETNLRGPFLLARAAATALKSSQGYVINISSAGGITPGSSSIAYSSSKAGLNHLTRCLAVAMAPEVKVNCIAPGLVEGTRMANRLPQRNAEGARRQAVLKRVGALEDISEQVVTFCRSDSVTGQTIVIDGGMPGAMR